VAKTIEKPIDKSLPDWAKNATIYEVNMRQFTKEGTFQSFIPHIDTLKKWLLPYIKLE